MAHHIRAAGLHGYLETMAVLGADPRPLLKEQGLTVAQLGQPELFIPALAGFRLLERSAQVTGCQTIGLRMAAGRGLSSLGAPGLLIAHQPTLRLALAALTEYRARINSTLVISVEQHGDDVIVREDFSLARPEQTRQSSNLAVAVLFRLCAWVLGAGWTPLQVCFSHQVPAPNEMAQFVQLFRCRPEFNCEFNGLVFEAADLDRTNEYVDDQLAAHARDLLGSDVGPQTDRTARDVEKLIRMLLPSGRATVQSCAALLGVSVRTLQRSLDAEGVSFTDLLNRARMQLATEYLANSDMRVTEIAQLLGYRSLSSFTRWHAQVFHLAPLGRRRHLNPRRDGKGVG